MKTSTLINRQMCLPHMSTQPLDHCSADCSLCACTATSAPVEREWLTMKPYPAKMGDTMLELLMYLRRNGNWSDCASALLTHKVACMVSWCNRAVIVTVSVWIFLKLDTWIGILCHCDIVKVNFCTLLIKVAWMLAMWCGVLVLLVLRVGVSVLVLRPGVLLTSLQARSIKPSTQTIMLIK